MPRGIIYAALILVSLTLIPLALIARARVSDARMPRIQVIPDMDSQPKFKAQQRNPIFADGHTQIHETTWFCHAPSPCYCQQVTPRVQGISVPAQT